jgi:hypothetical protein
VSSGWSERVSDGDAAARAGGRRRYNGVRRDRARFRRIAVVQRVLSDGWTYGVQARIAEELGVSDATICRDLKAIFPGAIQCPVCACRHPMERWKELERQGRVKMGCTSPDHEGTPPGRDDEGDVDADVQHDEAVAPVDAVRRQRTQDDLKRLKELANEMREQNAAGIASGDVVEPVNHMDYSDDTTEVPPGAPNGNAFNGVPNGRGLAPSHEPR